MAAMGKSSPATESCASDPGQQWFQDAADLLDRSSTGDGDDLVLRAQARNDRNMPGLNVEQAGEKPDQFGVGRTVDRRSGEGEAERPFLLTADDRF